jgi:Putative Actinobacterial Holin-X, holin superfamily III
VTEPQPSADLSVASVVGDVAADVVRLLRQEVQLARTELRAEATKAAKGVRSIAVGAVALHLVAISISAGAVLALSQALPKYLPRLTDWATAIATGVVAALWLVVGLVLLGTGRRRLRRVSPIPQQTVESLKEDIAWLRRPRG